ncbi:hypothetical protein AGR4A_pAt10330 [Agrobacterium tumefaciens str. B6]|uniref:Uncharacterized protein n=1 Tax=Agrobacterium tumefaciens str. B6 TaxID=1183423 RepID=A0A822VCY3_AGRTU|nr:hypothetical protein AGR4A_pAt10330 [Agrobacterium tumefaciens str. B6]
MRLRVGTYLHIAPSFSLRNALLQINFASSTERTLSNQGSHSDDWLIHIAHADANQAPHLRGPCRTSPP